MAVTSAAAPGPGASAAWLYPNAALGFIALICLKLLFFDVDHVPTAHHAIRRSRRTALTWLLLCQPALAYSVVVAAAGAGRVMRQTAGGDPLGARMLCLSMAALHIAFLLTRHQHRLEGGADGHGLHFCLQGAGLVAAAVAEGVLPALLPPEYLFSALATIGLLLVAVFMLDLVARAPLPGPPAISAAAAHASFSVHGPRVQFQSDTALLAGDAGGAKGADTFRESVALGPRLSTEIVEADLAGEGGP